MNVEGIFAIWAMPRMDETLVFSHTKDITEHPVQLAAGWPIFWEEILSWASRYLSTARFWASSRAFYRHKKRLQNSNVIWMIIKILAFTSWAYIICHALFLAPAAVTKSRPTLYDPSTGEGCHCLLWPFLEPHVNGWIQPQWKRWVNKC